MCSELRRQDADGIGWCVFFMWRLGIEEPAQFVMRSNNGLTRWAPCFLSEWPGWTTVAVNACAAIGANGGYGPLVEGYGCGGDV